ncbi:MAG: Nif3-like dinuclear metal center hexameric protein [Paenibacillaceae bacterium]
MSTNKAPYIVSNLLDALNVITKGRMVTDWNQITSGSNPYVVMKSSNIPGKNVIEIPGLIFGNMDKPITKVGVAMTLTESVIELASALEIELLVVHHPVADAANSGGVPFAHYLPLYNIDVIEIHEAFHGLHPGIAFMHGHQKLHTDINFGGIPGNVLHTGIVLEGIHTASDIISRLDLYTDREIEEGLLAFEQSVRENPDLKETTLANPPKLLSGQMDSKVNNILHFFPHTGFTVNHLTQALDLYPDTDTLIASISRVRKNHPLVKEAEKRGLTFIIGNPHSVEILENGIPLAYGIQLLLPELEVYMLRERVTASLLTSSGQPEIHQYGLDMASQYLVPQGKRERALNQKLTVLN